MGSERRYCWVEQIAQLALRRWSCLGCAAKQSEERDRVPVLLRTQGRADIHEKFDGYTESWLTVDFPAHSRATLIVLVAKVRILESPI